MQVIIHSFQRTLFYSINDCMWSLSVVAECLPITSYWASGEWNGYLCQACFPSHLRSWKNICYSPDAILGGKSPHLLKTKNEWPKINWPPASACKQQQIPLRKVSQPPNGPNFFLVTWAVGKLHKPESVFSSVKWRRYCILNKWGAQTKVDVQQRNLYSP